MELLRTRLFSHSVRTSPDLQFLMQLLTLGTYSERQHTNKKRTVAMRYKLIYPVGLRCATGYWLFPKKGWRLRGKGGIPAVGRKQLPLFQLYAELEAMGT